MNSFYADIEMVIAQADLSRKAARGIFAILNDDSERIPPYRALRLLRLLNYLKTGQFINQSTSRKKALLQNLIEILKQNDMSVSRMCYLFFDQAFSQKRPKHLLPEEMVMRLITEGRMERVDSVKVIVWDLLRRQGSQLARLVSPEDLTFVLWLDDPLTRNKFIMFMFRHFNADKVVGAICKYTSETGKRISSNISRQFIGLAQAETELKHRSRLLSNIITRSEFTHAEMDRIWADYLKGLNRFELIKIFSSTSDTLGWIEDLKKNRTQLSFNFEPTKDISSMTGSFASRVNAIQTRLN